ESRRQRDRLGGAKLEAAGLRFRANLYRPAAQPDLSAGKQERPRTVNDGRICQPRRQSGDDVAGSQIPKPDPIPGGGTEQATRRPRAHAVHSRVGRVAVQRAILPARGYLPPTDLVAKDPQPKPFVIPTKLRSQAVGAQQLLSGARVPEPGHFSAG